VAPCAVGEEGYHQNRSSKLFKDIMEKMLGKLTTTLQIFRDGINLSAKYPTLEKIGQIGV
jgi:hypothetical protein